MVDSENTQTAAEATMQPLPAAEGTMHVQAANSSSWQVTSKLPTTKPVAAPKAVAKKTRQVHKAQWLKLQ